MHHFDFMLINIIGPSDHQDVLHHAHDARHHQRVVLLHSYGMTLVHSEALQAHFVLHLQVATVCRDPSPIDGNNITKAIASHAPAQCTCI